MSSFDFRYPVELERQKAYTCYDLIVYGGFLFGYCLDMQFPFQLCNHLTEEDGAGYLNYLFAVTVIAQCLVLMAP